MAHQWRGVVEEYRSRLPFSDNVTAVTLGEGGTPLVRARHLSALTGCEVYLKVEGCNPTGSFKDRGMTTAITKAADDGAKVVVCASTGNTSASAAAYATAAGMTCAVLVPDGKIAMGKLSQAIAHGATLLQVDGNFDDCLEIARKLAEAYPVELVNSVNPYRIEGQKTAAFEIVDFLGDAPDVHCLPVEERHLGLAAEHVVPLGGLVADLIHRGHGEFEPHVGHDRPHSHQDEPSATPLMAFSATGMSNTRFLPCFSCSPVVVPNTPMGSGTPKPIR